MKLLSLYLLFIAAALQNFSTYGFSFSTVSKQRIQLLSMKMIQTDVSLPKDGKDAVSRCRAATQEALKAQLSRMDIEFPVGTKFGVEKSPKVKGKTNEGAPTQPVTELTGII